MDATIAPDIIADADAREARPVVDYEHQSIRARENGQPAPAAGWIQALAYFPGRGLFSKVEWTERARDLIKTGEYRYISPFFEFDNTTGAVQRLINAALTNTPALDGLMAVAASLNLSNADSVADLVNGAITEGILPKTLHGWAVALGNANPRELRAYLGKLRSSCRTSRPGTGEVALTAEEKEAAHLLGKTEAEYQAGKRLVALSDAPPSQVAALTAEEKKAGRMLGLTEVEFFTRKEGR